MGSVPASVVRWPAGTAPEGAPIHTWNALDIAAPPERVWPWLVRPLTWPTYYDNASHVRFLDGGPELTLRTRFRWKTFGVTVETIVTELVPNERLAWSGKTIGGAGQHGWVIEPTPGGCRVVTEETQRGIVPSLGRWFLRRGLLTQHQRWLEGLARMARTSPPA
jgi:uncharacterized protein YndB with AHSA1/START domain